MCAVRGPAQATTTEQETRAGRWLPGAALWELQGYSGEAHRTAPGGPQDTPPHPGFVMSLVYTEDARRRDV